MDNRPLSPHLTVYRPQITTILSITHRMTGVALYMGTALLVAWLWSSAYLPDYYETIHGCLTSWCGRVLLVGWTVAFYFHLANGIRHLFWDIGKGFDIPSMNRSGWLVILFTLIMTAMTWGFILSYAAGGEQ
ncbi:MAG: succinate dehydrogenase, cytochrome b556 subunit [Rickettsiales bacterium]|nr:succinate dehydrogenase, cytochrome b556 subunit [Rickettsiales bacterium]